MINLPEKTTVNKFIAKTAFYNKLNIATSVKNEFVDYIEKIVWKNKLSEDTIGITKTEDVEEIHIFEISLKVKNLPNNAIKSMLKAIPYPVLINIKYKDDFCYAVALYENKRFQNLFLSDWNDKIEFNFSGLNLKTIYEKIVKSILRQNDNGENLENIIEKTMSTNILEKEIKQLQSKIKSEKQFNRKIELNRLLNDKTNELEVIKNG